MTNLTIYANGQISDGETIRKERIFLDYNTGRRYIIDGEGRSLREVTHEYHTKALEQIVADTIGKTLG